MLQERPKVARITFGFCLVLIFLFSGLVLAHQCQASESINSATSSINNLHTDDMHPMGSSLAGSNLIITDVCVGFTFLVLLAGRKIFQHKRKFDFYFRLEFTRFIALKFTHYSNQVFTMSLPQLGVFRI